MKRLIPLFILAFLSAYSFGQNQIDALRYSQLFPGGTARTVAMGGAFGALGGDFYSVSQNPAGLGVYRRSEFTITPEIFYNNTSARYNGNTETDYSMNLNINNLAYISAFESGDEGLIGGSFGFGYNKLNNFQSNILIKGNNQQTSLGDMYVESANYGEGYGPVHPLDLLPFTEQLFYEGFIMDMRGNGEYILSNDIRDTITNSIDVDQVNNIERSGRMSEWVASAGFNYGHFLYFGGTLSMINVDYKESSIFSEYDGLSPSWKYFTFDEDLSTTGLGYTAKFGVIVKPIKMLRIGAAYHLPVTYFLTDTYDASLNSPAVGNIVPIDDNNDPLSSGTFDYQIVTPGKAVGSLGVVLGKFLVLSTDVEYINYASMKFSLDQFDSSYDQEFFGEVNSLIKTIYTNTVNVKTGAEVRLDKLYLRGGFGYFGSPYKKTELNRDAYQLSYSGGIGFRSENFFLDLALYYKTTKENTVLYSSEYAARPEAAALTSGTIKAMATFGFRF